MVGTVGIIVPFSLVHLFAGPTTFYRDDSNAYLSLVQRLLPLAGITMVGFSATWVSSNARG